MSNLISVIVPVYNAEQTLNRCVESIVAQTHSQLEIILVNDGSTDSSHSICRAWAQRDSRIHVIDGPNRGVASARNKGLEQARGEYYGFVDSDDWIAPIFFETLLQGFSLEPASSLTVVGAMQEPWAVYLGELCEGKPYCVLTHGQTLNEVLKREGLRGYLWNKLFRSTELRLDEKISVCEDLEFVIRYLNTHPDKPAVVFNEVLYFYDIAVVPPLQLRYAWPRVLTCLTAYEKIQTEVDEYPHLVNRVKGFVCALVYEMMIVWNTYPRDYQKTLDVDAYQIEHIKQLFIDYFPYGIQEAQGSKKIKYWLLRYAPSLLATLHILKNRKVL